MTVSQEGHQGSKKQKGTRPPPWMGAVMVGGGQPPRDKGDPIPASVRLVTLKGDTGRTALLCVLTGSMSCQEEAGGTESLG